ncbi:MAG: hypothetical protein ACQJCO_09285 [cyanobacterium endosymbiont of Rhopalodia sterrenbergii]
MVNSLNGKIAKVCCCSELIRFQRLPDLHASYYPWTARIITARYRLRTTLLSGMNRLG